MNKAAVSSLEVVRRTPLGKIPELPDHLLLGAVAGLSDRLSGPVIACWSARLNPKKGAQRHGGLA
jgi:hypothetical protein